MKYDFEPYHIIYRIYIIASWTVSCVSLPLYIYTLYYLAIRAKKHVKTYSYILFIKLLINFLYEQFTSALALIWFSPLMVNCPTGWISYFHLPPFIWQSVALCLAHVSLSQLYFYRMKSALYPSSWCRLIEKPAMLIYLLQYTTGFAIFILYVSQGKYTEDRQVYSEYATNLPSYFWSNTCHITPLMSLHPEVKSYFIASGIMALINSILVYATPIATIIIIYAKFRKSQSRNAKTQKRLLFSLILQTCVYYLFYLLPTHIAQTSLTSAWFNPFLIQVCIFSTEIHGSIIVILMFLTSTPFRNDLKNDLMVWRKSTASENVVIISQPVKIRSQSTIL